MDTTTTPELLTPEEWEERYGLHVVDPDGWRGPDAPSWATPITLRDFWARYTQSTARMVDDDTAARIRTDMNR